MFVHTVLCAFTVCLVTNEGFNMKLLHQFISIVSLADIGSWTHDQAYFGCGFDCNVVTIYVPWSFIYNRMRLLPRSIILYTVVMASCVEVSCSALYKTDKG